MDQNEQLHQLFITSRSNITTIIYKSCREIRATQVSHESDSFSLLVTPEKMNNTFYGTYGVAILHHSWNHLIIKEVGVVPLEFGTPGSQIVLLFLN